MVPVRRVEVQSSPVVSLDFDSAGKMEAWRRDVPDSGLRGAIVRVRVRLAPGESLDVAECQRVLLDRCGARVAHVTAEPAPQPRRERVEGLSEVASPRERMRRYLAAKFPGREDVAAEIMRIMGEEGVG